MDPLRSNKSGGTFGFPVERPEAQWDSLGVALGLPWGPFGTPLGSLWALPRGRFGTPLGSIWDPLGVPWEPPWGTFGTLLEPTRDALEALSDTSWAPESFKSQI